MLGEGGLRMRPHFDKSVTEGNVLQEEYVESLSKAMLRIQEEFLGKARENRKWFW